MLFHLYRILIYLLAPVIVLMQVFKGFRNAGYWQNWGERFGFCKAANAPYDLWMHAVSVGEVRAIVPLLQRLASSHEKIVLTVTTPTGRKTAETLLSCLLYTSPSPRDRG